MKFGKIFVGSISTGFLFIKTSPLIKADSQTRDTIVLLMDQLFEMSPIGQARPGLLLIKQHKIGTW